jgi:hypothetical protein
VTRSVDAPRLRGSAAAILAAAVLALAACAQPPLPSRLAGLPRTRLYTGQRAVRMLGEVHARRLAPKSAAVGVYGRRGELRVWLARFADGGEAQQVLRAMLERLDSGGTPFSPPRQQREWPNRFFSVGPGAHNVFWVADDAVYWLEGPPGIIDPALDGLPAPPSGTWT